MESFKATVFINNYSDENMAVVQELFIDGRSSAALGAVNIRMGDRRGDFVASEEKTAAIPRHPFRYALPIFPGEPNKCGSRFIATYPLSFFFV
jgi:hypothetical protein